MIGNTRLTTSSNLLHRQCMHVYKLPFGESKCLIVKLSTTEVHEDLVC